jgi:hypothetical protein
VAVTVSLLPRIGEAGVLVNATVGVAAATNVVVEAEVKMTGR